MKKVAVILFGLLVLSCNGSNKTEYPTDDFQHHDSEDSLELEISEIEDFCADFSRSPMPPDVAAEWDSMNARGGYLLVRGSERDLDTMVNHIHIIFTTKP